MRQAVEPVCVRLVHRGNGRDAIGLYLYERPWYDPALGRLSASTRCAGGIETRR
jgi:hypothetical protein